MRIEKAALRMGEGQPAKGLCMCVGVGGPLLSKLHMCEFSSHDFPQEQFTPISSWGTLPYHIVKCLPFHLQREHGKRMISCLVGNEICSVLS